MPFERTRATAGQTWVAGDIAAALAAGAGALMRRLQHARMVAVLAQFSDRQLAEIGIRRAEIPDYARRLIARD